MTMMDLILHFNARKHDDERISANHIAVYMALVDAWNALRRPDSFVCEIVDICQYARLKKSAIYRLLKELTEWEYVSYRHGKKGEEPPCFRFIIPSTWKDRGMVVETTRNDDGMNVERSWNGRGNNAEHIYKSIREEREEENRVFQSDAPEVLGTPETLDSSRRLQASNAGPSLEDVLSYANMHAELDGEDAKDFYYHYDAQGWKTGGEYGASIRSGWHSKLMQWCRNAKRKRAEQVRTGRNNVPDGYLDKNGVPLHL